jgi:hypothetical protein
MKKLFWTSLISLGLLASLHGFQKVPSTEVPSASNVARLKAVHAAVSREVMEDQNRLEQPLPDTLKKQVEATGIRPPAGEQFTYMVALKGSESALAKLVSTVNVTAKSTPDSCPVDYRAVAGGGFVYFGDTEAKHNVEPKTYEFVCKCSPKSKQSKTVECTENTVVQFACKK